MQAGKLRHTITIQSRTQTVDGFGGQVNAWTDYRDAKAAVETLSGRELVAAQAAHAESSVRFKTRFFDGLVTTMRIVYSGKYHDIISIVDPEERHRELIIITKQGMSEG